jgi:hypothetical protein
MLEDEQERCQAEECRLLEEEYRSALDMLYSLADVVEGFSSSPLGQLAGRHTGCLEHLRECPHEQDCPLGSRLLEAIFVIHALHDQRVIQLHFREINRKWTPKEH